MAINHLNFFEIYILFDNWSINFLVWLHLKPFSAKNDEEYLLEKWLIERYGRSKHEHWTIKRKKNITILLRTKMHWQNRTTSITVVLSCSWFFSLSLRVMENRKKSLQVVYMFLFVLLWMKSIEWRQVISLYSLETIMLVETEVYQGVFC